MELLHFMESACLDSKPFFDILAWIICKLGQDLLQPWCHIIDTTFLIFIQLIGSCAKLCQYIYFEHYDADADAVTRVIQSDIGVACFLYACPQFVVKAKGGQLVPFRGREPIVATANTFTF